MDYKSLNYDDNDAGEDDEDDDGREGFNEDNIYDNNQVGLTTIIMRIMTRMIIMIIFMTLMMMIMIKVMPNNELS